MPEIQERAIASQKAYITQLERGSLIQQEVKGSTRGSKNIAPQNYVDPFQGVTEGLGGGARGIAASPAEVRQTLENLDPRQIANMEAQRGASIKEIEDLLDRRGAPGDGESGGRKRKKGSSEEEGEGKKSGKSSDWRDESLGELDRFRGLQDEVMNELNTPGGMGPAARLGARGVASILGGSKFASLAKGVGTAGLVVGGALAVNSAVQNAGEQYQGLKNQGLVQGGGAMEGVGQEMQAYTMAISPFINVDQSRKIVQTALSEGYHGKQYETITEMVAFNTKEMAMDIGQSFALIKKQMIEGGQSSEGFKAQQILTKELAASSTTKSLPELQQEIASYQGSLIDMGTSGGVAGEIATQMSMTFPENADMKDVVSGIEGAVSQGYGNNMLMSGIMQYARSQGVQFPPNTAPYDIPELLGAEKFNQYLWGYLKRIAQRYKGNARGFYGMTQQLGLNLSPNNAKKLQNHLLGGADPAGEGKRGVDEAAGKMEDKGGVMGDTAVRGVQKKLEQIGGILAPILNAKSVDDFKNIPGKISENLENASGEYGRYNNPIVNNLLDTFGASQIEVLDENGKTQKIDTNNKEQMDRLGSGDYKWRKKGDTGGGNTLSESINMTGDSYKETKSEVSGQLQVELTPEAKRILQVPNQVQLTPNQYRANEGWGDSTPNNPPPGDAPVQPRGNSGWGR